MFLRRIFRTPPPLPALGLIIMLLGPACSRAEVRLGGYYEHTFQLDHAGDSDEQILDASKVRIDLTSKLSGSPINFRGNINFIQYHSDVAYDISPYLPDQIAQQLRDARFPLTTNIEQSRIFLDNAFLTYDGDALRLRAGKQQLSWGPGYSINPTDLFHRKNVLDPTYEKEGVTALRADYNWGIGGQATIITAIGDNFESTGLAARLATHIEKIGYDLAFTMHRIIDSTSVDSISLQQRLQRRYAVGIEVSGALLGLGAWVEGNHNWMRDEDDFVRIVAGLDYTFPGGFYVISEGLLNTRGADKTPYPLQNWLAGILYGEPVGPGWLLMGAQRNVTDLAEGAAYLYLSPDGSVLFNPRVDISIAQNADATVFGVATAGNGKGAFPPGLFSVLARITIYL
jgi:hypothetical protein